VALRADLRNPQPQAREEISAKVLRPPSDWESRTFLGVPGVVWSVSSDTCATGRLSAPDNVAYDHCHREFVFRQPRDERELAAVMSADSEEVYSCYRYDGLARWTPAAFDAWVQDMEVIVGYLRDALAKDLEPEQAQGLRLYDDYLSSADFRTYLVHFDRYLRSRAVQT
jgi:hypothetical protein